MLSSHIFRGRAVYYSNMLDFLPDRLAEAVRHINRNKLYELRVRADKPLRANLGGAYCCLGSAGVCGAANALIPTKEEVEQLVYAACDYSVYAAENQLRQGFVTGKSGERIGIAGTYVYEGGGVLSVRAITSVCIRVPHEIRGCADEIYERCCAGARVSLLLMSPPGKGKTTILRDLSRLVSEKEGANILISDERGEISAGDTGESDVMRFADKLTAFTAGIRAMRPDLIVTDELLPEDYSAVRRAIQGGIRVFASAHLTRYEDVPEKLFDRYILLSGIGKISAIYGAAGEDVG